MVVGPHTVGQPNLLKVADAVNALRFGLGFGEGRQKKARENGDDGNNDQQLDERESLHSGFANMIHSLVSLVSLFWDAQCLLYVVFECQLDSRNSNTGASAESWGKRPVYAAKRP